jgi:hypothetical protein
LPGRQTDRQTYRQKGFPGKQTGIQIEGLAGKLTERQKNKWTDMDGKMDRQKDGPWQTDRKFPNRQRDDLRGRQADRSKQGRQVCHADRFVMQTCLPCRQVCHEDMFAMHTGLPCRQVCHEDMFVMQTGLVCHEDMFAMHTDLPCRHAESSPVLTGNIYIHVEGLPRRKEKFNSTNFYWVLCTSNVWV